MKVCPDTNCWIEDALVPGEQRGERVFLATIVLQELWAGARTAEKRAYVERVHALAWRQRRLLNPPTGAWVLSGQVLEVFARRGGWDEVILADGAARGKRSRGMSAARPANREHSVGGVVECGNSVPLYFLLFGAKKSSINRRTPQGPR